MTSGMLPTMQLLLNDHGTSRLAKPFCARVLRVHLPVMATKAESFIRLLKEKVKAGAVASQEGSLGAVDVRHTGGKARGE